MSIINDMPAAQYHGSDAVGDVEPPLLEGYQGPGPVHTLLIAAMGINILDNQDLEALAETIAELLSDEDLLRDMSVAARHLAKPDAARRIAREIVAALKDEQAVAIPTDLPEGVEWRGYVDSWRAEPA